MNFFCDSGGNIFHVDSEKVYQGSANANTIYFIGAFASNLSVTLAYRLPNGLWTAPILMTAVTDSTLLNIQDAQGQGYSVWTAKITGAVTERYGTVDVQFYVYGNNGTEKGAVVATALSSFEVSKGVPITLPELTDDYKKLLTDILSALSTVKETAREEAEATAEKVLEAKLDKSAESKIVYANNSVGEPFTIKYTAIATPYTMVYRDGAGRIQAESPEAEKDVANKAYVTEFVTNAIENKIDKTTGANKIYGTNGNGAQTMFPWVEGTSTGGQIAVAMRTVNGDILVRMPIDERGAVPKSYVDEKFVSTINNTDKTRPLFYARNSVNNGNADTGFYGTTAVNVNTVVLRDNQGRTMVAAPTEKLHAANKEYVDGKVAALVDSAPATLDTLKEVATAIQENETVVEALNGAIGTKANVDEVVKQQENDQLYNYRVYARTGTYEGDKETTMVTSSGSKESVAENCIPVRDSNGQFHVGVPTSSTHVANKAYVDGNFVDLTSNQTIGGNKTFTGKVVADEIEVYSDDAGTTSVIDSYGGFRVTQDNKTARFANTYIAINYPNTNFYFPTDEKSSGTFATREWVQENEKKLYRHRVELILVDASIYLDFVSSVSTEFVLDDLLNYFGVTGHTIAEYWGERGRGSLVVSFYSISGITEAISITGVIVNQDEITRFCEQDERVHNVFDTVIEI